MHSTLFQTVLQSLNKIMFSCAGRNIIDGPTIYKLYKNFKIDLKITFQMCSFIAFTPQKRVSNEKKKTKQKKERKHMYLYCTISFSVILFQNLKTKTHFIRNIMLDVIEEDRRRS